MEINKDEQQPQKKVWTAEEKWNFFFSRLIEEVLAPEGYKFVKVLGRRPVSNIQYLTQERIVQAIQKAIGVHMEFKVDLSAAIQMMIAQKRAKTIFDPGRGAAIQALEEVLKLVNELPPSKVVEAKDVPKGEEKDFM
jgi:hypothetical protein